MTLAQAVLTSFHCVIKRKKEKGHNSAMDLDNFIMTLAQVVLEIICSQGLHWVILREAEKGDYSVMDLENFTKS